MPRGGFFHPIQPKSLCTDGPMKPYRSQKGIPGSPSPKGSPDLHPQRGSPVPYPQRGSPAPFPQRGSLAPRPQRGPAGAHHALVGALLWVPRCPEHPRRPVRCSRGAGDAEQLCPGCRRRFEQAAFCFSISVLTPRSFSPLARPCLRSCFRSPAGCCLASLRGCPTGAQGLRSTNGAFIPRC